MNEKLMTSLNDKLSACVNKLTSYKLNKLTEIHDDVSSKHDATNY